VIGTIFLNKASASHISSVVPKLAALFRPRDKTKGREIIQGPRDNTNGREIKLMAAR